MKQLIRLKNVELYNNISSQQPNGEFIKISNLIASYKCIIEEIRDDISASIYGADLTKMIRISSVNSELENYLYTKLNNSSDNISKYQIKYGNNNYTIENLTRKYIDCKRL